MSETKFELCLSLSLRCRLFSNYAVSYYAVGNYGVNSVNSYAVGVVNLSGSLGLRTTRCERDSCESCEHENKLLHFFVKIFKCKTINCCIKTMQRYGDFQQCARKSFFFSDNRTLFNIW